MSNILDRDIKYLPGIGEKRAALLDKELGIRTFRDMLYTFPYRYIDRSRVYSISEIDSSMAYIQLRGRIIRTSTAGTGKGARLIATLRDDSGTIDLVFFKGVKWIQDKLSPNREYIVFGHGPSGTRPGRRERSLLLALHPHRHILQHRQAPKQRHLHQGIRPLPADPPAEDCRDRPGDPSPGSPLLPETAFPCICPGQHSFPQGYAEPRGCPLPSQVRGTLLPPAVPAAAEECENERGLRNPIPQGRNGIQLLLQQAAVRADRSAETGNQGDTARYRLRQADEPPPAGGRGQRQDDGGSAYGPDSSGQWIPGLRDGSYGSACSTAFPQFRTFACRLGGPGGPADRQHKGKRAKGNRRGAAQRRDRHPHRHPRGHRGQCGLLPSGIRGHRRTAPLRGGPAGQAETQGIRAAPHPGDDGHAHPQDPGHDALRRPGRVGHRRAASGPQAGADHTRDGGTAVQDVRLHQERDTQGAAGIHRLPSDQGVREARLPEPRAGLQYCGRLFQGPGVRHRSGARPAEERGQGLRHEALRRRQGGHPRGHLGHRGRGGRAQSRTRPST